VRHLTAILIACFLAALWLLALVLLSMLDEAAILR